MAASNAGQRRKEIAATDEVNAAAAEVLRLLGALIAEGARAGRGPGGFPGLICRGNTPVKAAGHRLRLSQR
ncbi:hypothetical protein [Mangrovicoccus ximenensis]|uniref:hypothetical protein n=1 Tax=Mangrovicoccus ximenensis TaxID=1911570 RepID=UPI001F254915|nr:hypothetical protein [Mangrovicoccus ximenensis]